MAYRIGFCGLILAVTLLSALGLGVGDRGSGRAADAPAAAIAAPLATSGEDGHNSRQAGAGTPTVTGTPATRTPTVTADNTDNSSLDNTDTRGRDNADNSGLDNFDFDNGDSSDDNDDNSGIDNLDNFLDNFEPLATLAPVPTITPLSIPGLIGTPVLPPSAQVQPPRPAPVVGGPCEFVRGFADLHRTLNGRDGTCLSDEFSDPNGTDDILQLTSLPAPNGLMVWNKATNSMRWTDGTSTWAYSKCLLQERLNTQVFAWELNPYLLIPESAPVPPGACDVLPRLAAERRGPGG